MSCPFHPDSRTKTLNPEAHNFYSLRQSYSDDAAIHEGKLMTGSIARDGKFRLQQRAGNKFLPTGVLNGLCHRNYLRFSCRPG